MNRGKRGHLKVSSHHSAPTSPSVWILCKPLASNPPESPRNRGNGYETERAPCRAAARGGFVVWRVERRLLQMLPVWRMFLDGSCSRKENDITSRHHAHLGIRIVCIQSTNVPVALAPFLVTQKKKKKNDWMREGPRSLVWRSQPVLPRPGGGLGGGCWLDASHLIFVTLDGMSPALSGLWSGAAWCVSRK